MGRLVLSVLLAVAVAAVGCTLISGGGDLTIGAPGGAGGTTGPGAGGAGGATGGDGGGSCDPANCPGVDEDCSYRACTGDACGMTNAPQGTDCEDVAEPQAKVCDGQGSCVECNDLEDCDGGDLCEANRCVPLHCVNTVQDVDETDVDCGGAECAPCANTQGCVVGSDCESGFCDSGIPGDPECAPCSSHADCSQADWCNADHNGGTCTDDKTLGDACTDDDECLGNVNCVATSLGSLCCDEACTGTCRSCRGGETGGTNGSCGDVEGGTDPYGECGNVASCEGTMCDGSGQCQVLTGGEICLPESCTAGVMDLADTCGAQGTCVDGGSASCAPYLCDGNTCATSCSSHGDCVSSYFCDTGNNFCEPDMPSGSACTDNEQCISGNCLANNTCQ